MILTPDIEVKFLVESNAIEGEYSSEALEDAVGAWRYAKKIKAMLPGDVLVIHHFLMRRIRPDIAGKWRNCEVFIGGLRKDNLGPVMLESKVREVTDQVNHPVSRRAKHPYKDQRCIEYHVKFEEIHPFEDGNGRVGRILYNWHRIKLGLPVHVIEAKYRKDYYLWFRK